VKEIFSYFLRNRYLHIYKNLLFA